MPFGLGARCTSLLTDCMTKSKFYAVRKGLVPGIYRSWDACKQQTQGVSGAVFQSFKTQQAAEHYLESEVGIAPLSTSTRRTPAKRKNRSSPEQGAPNVAAEASHSEDDAAEGRDSKEDRSCTARSDTAALPSWMDPDATYRLVNGVLLEQTQESMTDCLNT